MRDIFEAEIWWMAPLFKGIFEEREREKDHFETLPSHVVTNDA